jgi:hypothetical protein
VVTIIIRSCNDHCHSWEFLDIMPDYSLVEKDTDERYSCRAGAPLGSPTEVPSWCSMSRQGFH